MDHKANRLDSSVKALGWVSFLNDVATEMIYPLIPLFLSGVLGANATFVGAIEGSVQRVIVHPNTGSVIGVRSGGRGLGGT